MTLTTKLAKEVYEYVISNNYSLTKPISKIKLFDKLIDSKLSEPLSDYLTVGWVLCIGFVLEIRVFYIMYNPYFKSNRVNAY